MNTWARRGVYALVAGLTIAVVFVLFTQLTNQLQGFKQDGAANARAAEVNGDKVEALQKQVRGLGEKPVVTGPVEPVTPGTSSSSESPSSSGAGTVTPRAAEAAVASYCADNPCGSTGPTSGQVIAAIATYCDNRGRCQGPRGTAGKDGADGEQGPAGVDGVPGDNGATGDPGPQGGPGATGETGSPGEPGPAGQDGAQGEQGPAGPGPTAEAIAQAVTDYCADNACRGPAGADGAQGPQGPEGPQGPAGADGTDSTLEQVTAYCETQPDQCQGPTGPEGPAGPAGDPGPSGDPGPQGDPGPAGEQGPACPDGYTGQRLEVTTPDGSSTVFACVA